MAGGNEVGRSLRRRPPHAGHSYTVPDEPLPVGTWTGNDWPPQFYDHDDWVNVIDIADALGVDPGDDDLRDPALVAAVARCLTE